MNGRIELMRQIKILEVIDPKPIAAYLADGSFKTVQYGKNRIVHWAGDACSRLEIILSGIVAVERIDESGNLMTIATFACGDLLGGNLVFSSNPFYPMTVTAQQPSWLLEISKDRLFQLFTENHDFLKRYLEYVSDHAVILGDKIRHDVRRTIRESILSFLRSECQRQGTSIIRLPVSKKALAERIGVQRTSLSRELAKMRNEGLIRFTADLIELVQTGKGSG